MIRDRRGDNSCRKEARAVIEEWTFRERNGLNRIGRALWAYRRKGITDLWRNAMIRRRAVRWHRGRGGRQREQACIGVERENQEQNT